MRKIMICVVVASLLTGCQQTTQGRNTEAVVTDSMNEGSDIAVDNLKLPNLLNSFNEVVINGSPADSKEFVDRYITMASELDADIMLTMYVDHQNQYLDQYSEDIFIASYQNALLDAYDKSYNLEKLSKEYSEEIMNFLKAIKRDGFLLNYHEGLVTLYPDYNLLKNYENYVSDSIKGYIDILSRESSEILSADGGLTITWDELSYRVLNAERYLVKYENSIRYDEVFDLYKWYLNILLTGLPDTPIYYRNSNLIRNDVLQSYNKTIIHNTDMVTSNILEEYLDIIRTKDNKIDGEALDYVRETLKTISFSTY